MRILNRRERRGGIGTAADREHIERFGVALYRVVSPPVSEILINQTWRGGVGAEVSGGASFAQRCRKPAVVITTGLVETRVEDPPDPSEPATALRPGGFVTDRLYEIRYPKDYDNYTRADWKRWSDEVRRESSAWIADDARWTAVLVVVDDVPQPGVRTQVDDRFAAVAIDVPQGRLDVGIEHLRPTGPRIEIEKLRIARSTDLDQIRWRRHSRLPRPMP
jgi:hypothetical protein